MVTLVKRLTFPYSYKTALCVNAWHHSCEEVVENTTLCHPGLFQNSSLMITTNGF